MRVIATEPASYDGRRIRLGQVFEWDVVKYPKLPRWVVPDTSDKRAELANAPQVERDKAFQAAVAMAGPKRAGVTAVREVNTGLATAVGVSDPPRAPKVDYPDFKPAPPSVVMVPATEPSLF